MVKKRQNVKKALGFDPSDPAILKMIEKAPIGSTLTFEDSGLKGSSLGGKIPKGVRASVWQ